MRKSGKEEKSKKTMYKEFKEIYDKIVVDIPYLKSLEELEDMWKEIIEINKCKAQEGDENTIIVKLSQLYITEYCYLAMAVGEDGKYPQLQLILKHILINIGNTSFCVYKLAFDGFDYQAEILLRNLFELCMMLLNVVLDKEKMQELYDSAKEDNEKEVWNKFFRAYKMKDTVVSYEEKLGGNISKRWQKDTYSELSSYVHNDFFKLFMYSYTQVNDDNDRMELNLCGSNATRTEKILGELDNILWYTGMVFFKILGDEDIELSNEIICMSGKEVKEEDKEFWNIGFMIELLSRNIFAKIKEKEDTDS